MPTYRCPSCDNTFTVADSVAAECPSCRQVADEGLYCRVGADVVGPVSLQTVQEIVQKGLPVRRTGEEWTTAASMSEFVEKAGAGNDNPEPIAPSEDADRTDAAMPTAMAPGTSPTQ